MPQLRQVLFALLLVFPGLAVASSPRPDAGISWPSCSSPDQWFCVVSATVDGNPIQVGYDSAAPIFWSTDFENNNGLDAVVWSAVDPSSFLFPSQYLSSNIQVVMNTGDFHPSWGNARADQFDVLVSGDADAGYVLTLQGTATEANYNNALASSGGC